MEDELNKKQNTLLIIIIAILSILSILVIVLGYYFVSHEFLNNDKKEDKKTSEKLSNNEDKKNESQEVKYEFNPNNIINKDASYVYTLGEGVENASTFTYEKNDNGYKFCSNGSCEELTGEFTAFIGNMMFKGGQGMGDNYYFLISKNGELYYANEYDFGKVKVEKVEEIKDVVNLYTVSLTSEQITSPDGSTIVAQTKDGKLYDIYTYVR